MVPGQAKNLAQGQDGLGQPKSRTGRDSQNPGQDGEQNGTEQGPIELEFDDFDQTFFQQLIQLWLITISLPFDF